MNADQSDECLEKQLLTGIQLAGLFSAVDKSIFGAGVSICGHRRKLPPHTRTQTTDVKQQTRINNNSNKNICRF